jgi:hypothetical protein
MKYGLAIWLFILLSSFTLFNSGEWVKVDQKEWLDAVRLGGKWFIDHKKYEVSIHYESFADYESPISKDASEGYYRRSGSDSHSFALGIHTIQNERMKIVIDSSRKIIMISNRDTSERSSPYSYSDVIKMLENTKALSKQVTEKESTFRIEFNANSPYWRYEVVLDKGHQIKKIKMFLNTEVSPNEDDLKALKTKPRIELTLFNYKGEPAFTHSEFDESVYVSKKDDHFVATSRYEKYRLRDMRVNKGPQAQNKIK